MKRRAQFALACMVGLLGCDSLLGINDDDEPQPAGSSSSSGEPAPTSASSSGGELPGSSSGTSAPTDADPPPASSSGGSSSGGATSWSSWAAAEQALHAKREQGPALNRAAPLHCGQNRVFWLDQDMGVRSYDTVSKQSSDYNVTARSELLYRFSDRYFSVSDATFQNTLVYSSVTGNLLGSLPRPLHIAADDDTLFAVRQPQSGHRRVSRWAPGSSEINLSDEFESNQGPVSLDFQQMVVPSKIGAPLLLHLISTSSGQRGSVLLDGALSLIEAQPSPEGLLVWYSRNGQGSSLRWYKDDSDTQRVEIADELANRASNLSGAPTSAHKFMSRIGYWEGWLIYGSVYGLWGYRLLDGEVAPIQLSSATSALLVDSFCIARGSKTLAYRLLDDAANRVWLVRLDQVLP